MSPGIQEVYKRELDYSLDALNRAESDFSARSNYVLILDGVILSAMFAIFFGYDYLTFNISDELFVFTLIFSVSIGLMVASVLNVVYCVMVPGIYSYKKNHGKILDTIYNLSPGFFQNNSHSHVVYDEINTKYYFHLYKTDVLNRKSAILSAAGTFTFLSLLTAGIVH